jgi:hypothetical protein
MALGQTETVSNVVITSTPLAGAAYTARKPIFFPPTPPLLDSELPEI